MCTLHPIYNVQLLFEVARASVLLHLVPISLSAEWPLPRL